MLIQDDNISNESEKIFKDIMQNNCFQLKKLAKPQIQKKALYPKKDK